MTKLEEKLVELGYKKPKGYNRLYRKFVYGNRIIIFLNKDNKIIDNDSGINLGTKFGYIRTQRQIDNLQMAFDIMQKDLEVLKEYEN